MKDSPHLDDQGFQEVRVLVGDAVSWLGIATSRLGKMDHTNLRILTTISSHIESAQTVLTRSQRILLQHRQALQAEVDAYETAEREEGDAG